PPETHPPREGQHPRSPGRNETPEPVRGKGPHPAPPRGEKTDAANREDESSREPLLEKAPPLLDAGNWLTAAPHAEKLLPLTSMCWKEDPPLLPAAAHKPKPDLRWPSTYP